jgi:hypothetical protein
MSSGLCRADRLAAERVLANAVLDEAARGVTEILRRGDAGWLD